MSGVKLGGRESDLTIPESRVWFGHHAKPGSLPTGQDTHAPSQIPKRRNSKRVGSFSALIPHSSGKMLHSILQYVITLHLPSLNPVIPNPIICSETEFRTSDLLYASSQCRADHA